MNEIENENGTSRGNKSKVTEDVSTVDNVPINTVNIESDTSVKNNVNIESNTAVNIESNNESVNSQFGINLSATSVSS